MKTSDKIEFTPEQRESLLGLYAEMIESEHAAQMAGCYAARMHRFFWNEVREKLDLPSDRIYKILPNLGGVEVKTRDPLIGDNTEEALREWDRILGTLKHPTSLEKPTS